MALKGLLVTNATSPIKAAEIALQYSQLRHLWLDRSAAGSKDAPFYDVYGDRWCVTG